MDESGYMNKDMNQNETYSEVIEIKADGSVNTKSRHNLNIKVVTFNLAGQKPPLISELEDLFFPLQKGDSKENDDFDIYAIGSQECCRPISKSFLNPSKKLWEEKLKVIFETPINTKEAMEQELKKKSKKKSKKKNRIHPLPVTVVPTNNETQEDSKEREIERFERQKKRYKKVAALTLVGIHIIVYIKNRYFTSLKNIKTNKVCTGALNELLGNKGSVSIGFELHEKKFGDEPKKFLFINAHLSPYYCNATQRNKNYHKIITKTNKFFRDKKGRPKPKNETKGGSKVQPEEANSEIFSQFDGIFFFGDLNYRINGTKMIVEKILSKEYTNKEKEKEKEKEGWFKKKEKKEKNLVKIDAIEDKELLIILKNNDQLYINRIKEKKIFQGFEEGKIEFNPTYRFDKESDNYDTSKKQRIPAWTDRILYCSKRKPFLHLDKYDANFLCKYSDHRAVFAHFKYSI